MTRRGLSNLLALTGLFIAVAVGFGGTLLHGQTLVVQVTGLRSVQGVVHVLVYDDEAAFNDASLIDLATYATHRVSSDQLTVRLRGVLPGRYALMVHHDENENDVFDYRGALPLEGWGYSNNVGQVDIPTFASAVVTFDDMTIPLHVKVIYAN